MNQTGDKTGHSLVHFLLITGSFKRHLNYLDDCRDIFNNTPSHRHKVEINSTPMLNHKVEIYKRTDQGGVGRYIRLPETIIVGSQLYAGDLGFIPGLGRSPGEGKDYSFQYSGLENFMDYIVHGVAKSRTRLSDFHFHNGYNLVI